jgi:hypothetical protein
VTARQTVFLVPQEPNALHRASMLAVIVNHNQNANAIKLRREFAAHAPTRLVDSGSRIAPEELPWFDEVLPNVYYSGLLNRAYELAQPLDGATPVLFICSDVLIASPAHLVARLEQAFRNPQVEAWAPSSLGSGFRQMWPRAGQRLRSASFVEGFCFAARKRLLAGLCPVDVATNALGWGLDVQLGYLAARYGGASVVDDGVEVIHPRGSGYDTAAARRQNKAWLERLSPEARRYSRFAKEPLFCGGAGLWLIRLMFRDRSSQAAHTVPVPPRAA